MIDEAALARRRGQDPLDAGRRRVDPAQLGARGQEPVEASGWQPAAEHHLDVVERTVGEALERIVTSRAPAPRPGSLARSRAR